MIGSSAVRRGGSFCRILPLASLLAATAGCADALVDNYRYGSVEVVAVSANGKPGEGIHLILHRGGEHLAYGTTDASGRYVFDFVPTGRLGVFATLPETLSTPNYYNWIAVNEIPLEPGAHQRVELSVLRCDNRIDVRVVDDDAAPLADIVVDLYRSDGVIRQDTTGLDGVVRFTGVPCGNLGVAIAVPAGYSAPPGRGGSYMDGLLTREDDMHAVEFVLTRL